MLDKQTSTIYLRDVDGEFIPKDAESKAKLGFFRLTYQNFDIMTPRLVKMGFALAITK